MRAQGYGPSEAFDITRDRIRKIFYELRKGVEWQGRIYRIDEAYCTKVEFHNDEEGWPHFHIIWLTRRFVPSDMLSSLWGFGRTNVKRIQNDDFHYLLKYVCKDGKIPEWVQQRERLRIFQPSRGFLLPTGEPPRPKSEPTGQKRPRTTIGERLHKWERLAILVTDTPELSYKQVRPLPLDQPFKQLFDRLVYAVALDGRYLGDGKIIINKPKELYPWLIKQQTNTPLPV